MIIRTIRLYLYLGGIVLFGSNNVYNTAPDFDFIDYEREIVVCIPSYNNEKWCIQCLESVYSQNYSNFRVIYIDDCSTDRTFEMVLEYVRENGYNDKSILITNETNMGMLYNHHFMADLCEAHEIVVSLDGDDSFSNNEVLSRINRAYMDPDVWTTYGQFQETGPVYEHKPRAMLKHKLNPYIIRRVPFMFMQPRTYYAGLFHLIPVEQLKFMGSYYKYAGDVAIMLAIIDMAREHTYFIPDIICNYNNDTEINDFRINRQNQLITEKVIKRVKPLDALEKLYW